jgi:hypothetical protein
MTADVVKSAIVVHRSPRHHVTVEANETAAAVVPRRKSSCETRRYLLL